MESNIGLWLGILETGVALVLVFILGSGGWPGEDDDCIARQDCHCERLRSGIIKQPSNTWSNLAFVLVGLVILGARIWDRTKAVDVQNPMATVPIYSITFGILLVTVGLGSIFFHASIKRWGSVVDNLAMYLFLTYVILYDLFRLAGWDNVAAFFLVFILVNIGLGAVRLWKERSEKYVFRVLFGSLIAVEVLLALNLPIAAGIFRDWTPWLAAELIAFGAAYLIWYLSATGRPLCRPDSWLQGHAVWHIIGAAAVGFLYLNLLSEVVV